MSRAGDVVLLSPLTVFKLSRNSSEHSRWSLCWTYQSTSRPALYKDACAIVRSFEDIDREVQTALEWANFVAST